MVMVPEVPQAISAGGAPERTGNRGRSRGAGRAAGVLSLVWLGYVLVHLVLSGRWWPMLLPDLAPPLVFVLVPLALVALSALGFLRGAGGRPVTRVRTWIPILAAVAALVAGVEPAGLNLDVFDHGVAPPAGALHVVSWNTEYWDRDDDPSRFYAYLRSFHADVYLLQEYLNWHAGAPLRVDDSARLRAEFPGYQIATVGELLTLSRVPIVSSAGLDDSRWYPSVPAGSDFPDFWRDKTLRTTLKVGSTNLSIYNVHIPVQLGPIGVSLLAEMHQQASRRDAAWRALAADLAETSGPKLVAGDFNTTPAMGELSHLDELLRRAQPTNGQLYPTSWSARSVGLWRLDFAYYSASITIDQYNFRDSAGFSDHDAQDFWIDTANGPSA
jgi:endonuclease/exonuclease/phosphatase (EEP) superfamily protein YafD